MRKVFDTNFFGAIDVVKTVLPQMRKRHSSLLLSLHCSYLGLLSRNLFSYQRGIRTRNRGYSYGSEGDSSNQHSSWWCSHQHCSREISHACWKLCVQGKYQANLDLMNSHVDKGMDPLVMAEKITQIINTKSPKTHYKVGGFMEKFSIVLKRILPDKTYERLLMNHYKL